MILLFQLLSADIYDFDWLKEIQLDTNDLDRSYFIIFFKIWSWSTMKNSLESFYI